MVFLTLFLPIFVFARGGRWSLFFSFRHQANHSNNSIWFVDYDFDDESRPAIEFNSYPLKPKLFVSCDKLEPGIDDNYIWSIDSSSHGVFFTINFYNKSYPFANIYRKDFESNSVERLFPDQKFKRRTVSQFPDPIKKPNELFILESSDDVDKYVNIWKTDLSSPTQKLEHFCRIEQDVVFTIRNLLYHETEGLYYGLIHVSYEEKEEGDSNHLFQSKILVMTEKCEIKDVWRLPLWYSMHDMILFQKYNSVVSDTLIIPGHDTLLDKWQIYEYFLSSSSVINREPNVILSPEEMIGPGIALNSIMASSSSKKSNNNSNNNEFLGRIYYSVLPTDKVCAVMAIDFSDNSNSSFCFINRPWLLLQEKNGPHYDPLIYVMTNVLKKNN